MIGLEHVFVVCEAGVTNYGELELALRQVDAAVEAGADAVKFQAWVTEALVSREAAAAAREALGYDWFERLEERRLSEGDLRRVRDYAAERGITFFASPHDEVSLRFLVDELEVPMLKVGSGEAANERFLRAVGAAGRPTLISFGLQSVEEAKRAGDILRAAGAAEVVPLHCVTLYPTPYSLARLDRLATLREALGLPIGISDHTVGRHVALAAVALGARVVEKHFTLSRDMYGPDASLALEPDELEDLVEGVREIETMLANPVDKDELEPFAEMKRVFEKSVVAVADIPTGATLEEAMLAAKKPGTGIPAHRLREVVGRRARVDIAADSVLTEDALE